MDIFVGTEGAFVSPFYLLQFPTRVVGTEGAFVFSVSFYFNYFDSHLAEVWLGNDSTIYRSLISLSHAYLSSLMITQYWQKHIYVPNFTIMVAKSQTAAVSFGSVIL